MGIGSSHLFKRSARSALVGKHVQVYHRKHIRCDKNVKFEEYAEIHKLCSERLSFGNNVTISQGAMICPSSHYGGDLGVGLTMGSHSYIGCYGKITIGKNVMFAENHVFSDKGTSIKS